MPGRLSGTIIHKGQGGVVGVEVPPFSGALTPGVMLAGAPKTRLRV